MSIESFNGSIPQQPKSENFPSANIELDKPILLLSHNEQQVVFTAIYHFLNTHTRYEVEGHLDKIGIEENNLLRELLKQLASSLGKELHSQEWLYIGVTDFIPDDKLREWAYPTEKSHWTDEQLHRTAQYFKRVKT